MKMLTASDLRVGEVVYWTGAAWSRAIGDGLLMEDDAAEAALAAAKKSDTQVVGAYLVVMEKQGTPSHREAMRENIRARGPSTEPHVGKQAGN